MIKLSRVIDFEVAAMDNAFERMDDPGRRAPLHNNRMFHGIGKEKKREEVKSVARLRRNNALYVSFTLTSLIYLITPLDS